MSSVTQFLPWNAPLIYLLLSVFLPTRQSRAWALAHWSAVLVFGLALATAGLAFLDASSAQVVDTVGLTMSVLVTFLGWVIVRYSMRYLEGEPGQRRYLRALMFTLAAVNTVVVTHHLGVLVVAWAASSLGLHHLLTFYPQRREALIVAHKKFLISRLAELCLLAGLILTYKEIGTLNLEAMAQRIGQLHSLPVGLDAAAALFALAAILKSAQLPVHGWLIQVMEAPTPVSALLHAGIVNIGGFVMIRLAALVSASVAAQTLLVVVGSLTAVLAGLVMMTRISIKVRLAWSTCAQMGFMLMECGLGLYELAFLHLIAHSLYKAYSFLTTGECVQHARQRNLARSVADHSAQHAVGRRFVAVPLAFALLMLSLRAWQALVPGMQVAPVALVIVGLALAPMLLANPAKGGHPLVRDMLRAFALVQIYFLWHLCFAALTPATAVAPMPLVIWTGGCFAALYLLQTWLLAYPQGALSATLYPWAYAGFYLDERFTRLTFRIWPAQLPARKPGSLVPYRPVYRGEQA